jgi:hypothetical protein
MSFQAKRLRVQLASGKTVAFDPGDGSDGGAEEEAIIKGVCLDSASFVHGSCVDDFTTALLVTLAPVSSLSAEQLPALRTELEGRLAEIDAAEQNLGSAE